MVPLDGRYDIEESLSPWKFSCTFGAGEWASDPVEDMDTRHCQSSWISTRDGRKRFHRDIPTKTSSAIVPTEQISYLNGEPPVQDFLPPLTGAWSDQTLPQVLHHSASQPSEVKCPHVTSLSESMSRSQDVDTATVDHPSRVYMENYVSSFPASVLLTDENMGRHRITTEFADHFTLMEGWDPRWSSADLPNENVLRNQETRFADEMSSDNGQKLWSTPYCPVVRDAGGSLQSARSVISEGRQSEIEVKMEQSSPGEVPDVIADRNRHMQGIMEAMYLVDGRDVQTAEMNQRKVFLEQSLLSQLNRRTELLGSKTSFSPNIGFLEDGTRQSSKFLPETGMLTTGAQDSQIPYHDGIDVSSFAGRSVETLPPALTGAASAIRSDQLSLQVPTGPPLSTLPTANKCNLFGGSSQSSQVPRLPLHLTPHLQNPPQPKEQMVGVQQSFTISTQNQNGCSCTSPAFQENLQGKLVSGFGRGRFQQLENSTWQQAMNGLERDAVYEQPELRLPEGPPVGMDTQGVGSVVSGSPPDWTSNEALAMQQLQATMAQLDVGTRLCIRNALYRLAKSAKERRNCRAHSISQDLAEPDSAAVSSCVTGAGSCDGSRLAETQTNHLDRSIANLLFSTGPFRKYGQPPAYKVRSASQTLPGIQNGPWLWSSTGMTGNNWSSSLCKQVEPLGVAPRVQSCNPLNSSWAASQSVHDPYPTTIDSCLDHDNMRIDKSGAPDSYERFDTQADRLNMPLSSSIRTRALVSASGAFNFDRSGISSQSRWISEGLRPEGSVRGQETTEDDLDIDQTLASSANINYQYALMPHKEDVVNDAARGRMFDGDMDSIISSHSVDPVEKDELGIAELWHDQ